MTTYSTVDLVILDVIQEMLKSSKAVFLHNAYVSEGFWKDGEKEQIPYAAQRSIVDFYGDEWEGFEWRRGGSSLNTLSAVLRASPDDTIEIRFVTSIGTGQKGTELRDAIEKGEGIYVVIPGFEKEDRKATTAISHVFLNPDGNRKILTYPGSIIEELRTKAGRTQLKKQIKKSDAFFMAGSLDLKLGHTLTALILGFVKESKSTDLFFSLPTKSDSYKDERNKPLYQQAVRESKVTFGNMEEAAQLYELRLTEVPKERPEGMSEPSYKGLKTKRKNNKDRIIEHLKENVLYAPKAKCEAIAITDDKNGMIIVTKENTIEVPPHCLDTKKIEGTGAGDHAVAGFLLAYNEGADMETCGRMAMAWADLAIQVVGAKVDTQMLRERTQKIMPEIYKLDVKPEAKEISETDEERFKRIDDKITEYGK